jgi:hypothetical protein
MRHRHHFDRQLADVPPDTPAVVLIGDRLTLAGTYSAALVDSADAGRAQVAVSLVLPACSCTDPETDVDPDCPRCYPEPPEALVALVARAVAASRGWSYRAGMGPHIPHCTDTDVNAAEAVLAVLMRPGRHGVFCNEPRTVTP